MAEIKKKEKETSPKFLWAEGKVISMLCTCGKETDISNTPDFEVGTFRCECGKDNTVRKADL